jgi:CubicO group peptidase (beta-lactamase class C family)
MNLLLNNKFEVKMNWNQVDRVLAESVIPFNSGDAPEAVLKRKFATPGAVLLVGKDGEVVYHKAYGCRSVLPEITPMRKDLVFDVASLTKPMITTTLTMKAVEQGLITVDKKLSQIFQTYGTHGKERITVRHLLSHCSGYAAHLPFFRTIDHADKTDRLGIMTSRGAVEQIYREIFRSALENLPGKVTKYSDIGFILLGHVLETIYGSVHLDKLALQEVLQPLSLKSTGYIDISKVKPRGIEPISDVIVPTTNCPWRRRIICGEVQDENAWAMGGIAAHAGIFSTAIDIHKYAVEMIKCWQGSGRLISRDIVREFWTVDKTVPGSTWCLGWDSPSPENSSAGKYFSKGSSVGHLGYTGCSMWLDAERSVDVVLLTNRVHPRADNNGIKEFRPLVYDAVMEALGYAQ